MSLLILLTSAIMLVMNSLPAAGIARPGFMWLVEMTWHNSGSTNNAGSVTFHFVSIWQMGYNGGIPITEDFFSSFISGRHNSEIGVFLFPDWDQQRRDQWLDDKETYFRRSFSVSILAERSITLYRETFSTPTVR